MKRNIAALLAALCLCLLPACQAQPQQEEAPEEEAAPVAAEMHAAVSDPEGRLRRSMRISTSRKSSRWMTI